MKTDNKPNNNNNNNETNKKYTNQEIGKKGPPPAYEAKKRSIKPITPLEKEVGRMINDEKQELGIINEKNETNFKFTDVLIAPLTKSNLARHNMKNSGSTNSISNRIISGNNYTPAHSTVKCNSLSI